METLNLIKSLSLSYEIALAIGNSLDLQEMLNQVLKTIVRKGGAYWGIIWLWDGQKLEYVTGAGFRMRAANRHPGNKETDDFKRKAEAILKQGRPVVKTEQDGDFKEFCIPYSGREKAVLLIPVEDLALVSLSFTRPDAIEEGLARIIGGIVPRLGNAILSCLNYQQTLAAEKTRRYYSETKYRELVNNLNVGIYRSTVEGRFLDANPAFLKMFGFRDFPEISGLLWPSLYADPLQRKSFLNEIMQQGFVKNWEVLFKRKDGDPFWAQVTAVLSSEREGGEKHIMGIVEDITERKRLEIQLRESEGRYRLLCENALVGVYLFQAGTFRYVNPTFANIFGYRAEEIIDRINALELVEPRDRPLVAKNIRICLEDGAEKAHYIFQGLRKDGKVITCEAMGKRVDYNGVPAILGTLLDITERKRAESRMEYLSSHDVLTGFYNRVYFEQTVEQMRNDFSRYPIAVFMCDIDGLKVVNDTLGHEKGDELLKAAATVLRRCFRAGDVVARIGGDEFVAILPNTDSREGEAIARRILKAVDEFNGENPELHLSLSVGAAIARWPHQPLDEALKLADKAMYTNKAAVESGIVGRFVRSLLTALAARDLETEKHTERVKELAMRLGAACGLPDEEMSVLATLAKLHDIGKIGIPDQILLKRSALTPEERRIMEKHVEIGYQLALAMPEISSIAEYILHHHEWWNGKGYPAGLRGQEIPIVCRIIAIVDAYDAMSSPRPYRQKPLKKEDVITELRRCAGKQFDPDLVENFIAIITEDKESS